MTRHTTFKIAWLLFCLVAIAFVLRTAYSRLHRPSGEELNRLAWEASFRERALPVPVGGPRDGYWGSRMPKPVEDDDTGWREGVAHLDGLAHVDAAGIQWAGDDVPGARRIVILGASVAWGSYSSSIETAYFERLRRRIEPRIGPVRLAVVAAGAWDSENERLAFEKRVLPLDPEVVLLLNGMNDLTRSSARRRRRVGWPEVAARDAVPRYLANMAAIRDLAWARRVVVVFALQPFVLSKARKTPLERRVLELTFTQGLTERMLAEGFPALRAGLQALCRDGRARCADTGGVFDGEEATTFTDAWHFADPGHALLSDALAGPLTDLLSQMPPRPRTTAK